MTWMADTYEGDQADAREAERKELRRMAMARRAAIPPQERAFRSFDLCQELLVSLDMTLALAGAVPAQAATIDGVSVAPDQDASTDDVPVVAVYAAFPEELDLAEFIDGAYARGVRVAFPVMMEDAVAENDVAQTMEMRDMPANLWRDMRSGGLQPDFLAHPLHRHRHDDPRLANHAYVSPSKLAMVVVPLVAFDADGNRLGYGGGNYDRYLTQVTTATRLVGVAFAEQQVDAVPVEGHDVPVTVLAV